MYFDNGPDLSHEALRLLSWPDIKPYFSMFKLLRLENCIIELGNLREAQMPKKNIRKKFKNYYVIIFISDVVIILMLTYNNSLTTLAITEEHDFSQMCQLLWSCLVL